MKYAVHVAIVRDTDFADNSLYHMCIRGLPQIPPYLSFTHHFHLCSSKLSLSFMCSCLFLSVMTKPLLFLISWLSLLETILGIEALWMSCNISVAKTKCCSSLLYLGLSIESISTFHVLVQKIGKLQVGMFKRGAA